jgi:UDP-N-acetylmuramate--alanine ligase
MGELKLSIPGRHNALNALAALALAQEIGVPFDLALQSLRNFKGVVRRFQFKGQVGRVMVYDDYAHHPTEVRATLQAFREKFPEQKLVLVFQPHRYTRTRACWDEFLDCFTGADELYISDIYPAGEAPLAGIDGKTLADQVRGVKAQYLSRSELVEVLLRRLLVLSQAGSVRLSDRLLDESISDQIIFATFGAGDCWRWGEDLLLKLQEANFEKSKLQKASFKQEASFEKGKR